jgi:hypothetical protein
MGHLDALRQAGDALNNGDTPALNSVVNLVRSTMGDARVNNFQTAADAVADELERAFRGTAGAVTGIRNWRERLKANASPDQMAGAWKELVQLLDSRIESLGDQYSRGMGKTTDGLSLLSPHAREAYQHLTGRTPDNPVIDQTGKRQAPADGGSAAAPLPMVTQDGRSVPDASKLKGGMIYTLPNGQRARFDDKRMGFVPVQ